MHHFWTHSHVENIFTLLIPILTELKRNTDSAIWSNYTQWIISFPKTDEERVEKNRTNNWQTKDRETTLRCKRWLETETKRKREWVKCVVADKVDGLSLVVNTVWFGDLFIVLIYSAAVQNIALWLLLYQ